MQSVHTTAECRFIPRCTVFRPSNQIGAIFGEISERYYMPSITIPNPIRKYYVYIYLALVACLYALLLRISDFRAFIPVFRAYCSDFGAIVPIWLEGLRLRKFFVSRACDVSVVT